MLFNPKWGNPNHVLENTTLAELISWLETKPAAGTYDYASQDCVLCQFLRERGVAPFVSSSQWNGVPLPPRFDDIAAGRAGHAGATPADLPVWSYGGALARARACR